MYRQRKWIAIILAMVILLSNMPTFAASVAEEAKLIFSGVTLQDAGDSTQVFLDFKVKNIENQGVTFDLEYNTDYVALSNVADNAAIELDDNDPLQGNFFSTYPAIQINNNFSEDTFIMAGQHTSSKQNSNYNMLHLDFAVNSEYLGPDDEYIGTTTINLGDGTPTTTRIIRAKNKEVMLGSISFRVKTPSVFAELTPEEMQSVFRLKQDDNTGKSAFAISYIDFTTYPPSVFTENDSNLEYQFDIKNPISLVTADRSGLTVSAAEIYEYDPTAGGTDKDLIAYLNAHMQDITIKYSNQVMLKSTVTWGDPAKNFKFRRIDPTGGYILWNWDPKGGEYEIEQDFNDDITIKAKLFVTPVKLTGYSVSRDNITYVKEADLPQDKNALELPTTAKPFFDQVVPRHEKYQIALPAPDSWEQTAPAINADGKNDFFYRNSTDPDVEKVDKRGAYVFSCEIPEKNISDVIPWVTFETPQTISVNRNFYDNGLGAPVKVEASTDDDGLMTIKVGSVTEFGTPNGLDILPQGMDFDIRMPNGEILNRSNFPSGGEGIFHVELNQPMNGQATIKLKAGDLTNVQQQKLSQYINMGDRLGNFSIAAKQQATDSSDQQGEKNSWIRSVWTSFYSNPRRNIYLNEAGRQEAGNYTFDYTANQSSFFRFEEGMTAPDLTIRLPQLGGSEDQNRVNTVYDGTNGVEPGALTIITVNSWTLQADQCETTDGSVVAAISDLKPGDTAVFLGTLAEINTGNWGKVSNPNGVTATLKVTVQEASEPGKTEQIRDIKDFAFDQRRVGYTSADLQTKEFTIENIGRVNISGLTVSLSATSASDVLPGGDSQSENYQAFTLLSQPIYLLETGGQATFRISTREGLPAGKYTAQVTISSNKTAILDQFNVTFVVSSKELYEVEVLMQPTGVGTVTLPGGSFYSEGDTVDLTVDITDPDYSFYRWEVDGSTGIDGSAISFAPSDTESAVRFIMPDLTDPAINPSGAKKLTIWAFLNPEDGALVRLQDLKLYNPDGTENPLLDDTYKAIAFEPGRTAYVALADAVTEENIAEYHFAANPGETVTGSAILTQMDADSTVTATYNLNVSAMTDDPTGWRTETFPLAKAPMKNVLEITLEKEVPANDGNGVRIVKKTYSVTIYRKLNADEMIRFNYGNSPYGLVMRDAAVADDQKQTWKDKFDEGNSAVAKSARNSFVAGFTPQGGKTGLIYREDAWGDSAAEGYVNYDKNDFALFAYSGAEFSDPGVAGLTDSLGKPIDFTAAGKVKRTFTVMTLSDVPRSNPISDFTTVKSKTVSYATTAPIDSEALVNDLKGLRIRPDIYKIEYTFEDYDGTVVTAERPLIILPGRGDLNVNGSAGAEDAQLIAGRAKIKLPYTIRGYETGGNLYKYRVCDVNTDRNINIADKRYIEQHTGNIVEFY